MHPLNLVNTMSIWPSLLAANLLNLEHDILQLESHGIHQLHLDIMDNHYVPNLSFGPAFCQSIHQRFPNTMIDVHLMIEPVDQMIEIFAKSGAKRISIHPQSTRHLNYSLNLIKRNHCLAGIVLNPADDLNILNWCQHQLDYILVMTVNPGFGGQTLLSEVIAKIKQIKLEFPHLPIMVDGGVNLDNITLLRQSGANDLVIGSAFFQSQNFPHNILDFIQLVNTND